jgi:tetratricopeptide (TPR) repeat protein
MTTSLKCIFCLSLLIALLITTVSRNAIWHTGLTLWHDAVNKNPHNRRAYSNLCTYYSAERNFKLGFEVCDKALSAIPEVPDRYYINALINRGALYSGYGNYDRAIQDYHMAISLEPSNARTYNNIGNAYTLQGNLSDALQSYSRAISLNPNYVLAYSNRGVLHQRLGNHQSAIEDLSKAILLRPEDPKNYVQRGVTYIEIHDTDKAVLDFNVACKMRNREGCDYLQKTVKQ